MFYIIERSDQLQQLKSFGDCFISFIPKNNNFHPALTSLSLIYIRPIDEKKGYILCLDHNESFSLNQTEVNDWLSNNTNRLFLFDKKEALHWVYPLSSKLFDIHLIEFVDLTEALSNSCINYYYTNHTNLSNINCLIPISKHYEECEAIFKVSLPIIQKYTLTNTAFQFQNFRTTEIFYQIEKNGIKANKNCFIEYYTRGLKYPEFNLYRGKIYTQYNLYTTTSRPSNAYNNINFAALNKDDGERNCYKPENDMFIETDFQGYHPRLIGEMVGFEFSKDRNTYELLSELLNVSQQDAKELTFKQLYGGIWSEYQNKPFFKEVAMYIDNMWDIYQHNGYIATENKIFTRNQLDKITPQKLFNYIVQSKETSTNVELLELVLNYLKDKKTKIVLYTYDAFLFDYAKEDGHILTELTNILEYPVNVKQGTSYHGLTKI
jgi:hypothetical protein